MTSWLPTPRVDDGDTPTRFGEQRSRERQIRSGMQNRIARLKRFAQACIRDDEKDSPKSHRSLMPATAIARRLPAANRDNFWEALRARIRAGAFDPSPDEKAPLRVFNDSRPLRLTSDKLIELTADDGIDGLEEKKPVFDEGYLKKTWARIDTWSRWCRGERVEIPESWRRIMEAQDQSDEHRMERLEDHLDASASQVQEARKSTFVREAIERLGPSEAGESIKAYQARISANIVETTNETVSPRHVAEVERLVSGRKGKKAKKGSAVDCL